MGGAWLSSASSLGRLRTTLWGLCSSGTRWPSTYIRAHTVDRSGQVRQLERLQHVGHQQEKEEDEEEVSVDFNKFNGHDLFNDLLISNLVKNHILVQIKF